MNKDSGELEYDELNSHIKTLNSVIKDYDKKNKELHERLNDCTENYNHYVDKCFKLEDENKQLQARVDELEKVLASFCCCTKIEMCEACKVLPTNVSIND